MNCRLALPSLLALAALAAVPACGDDPIPAVDAFDSLAVLDTGTPIDRDAVVTPDLFVPDATADPDTSGGTDSAVGPDTSAPSCDDPVKPFYCPCENNVQCASGYCIPVDEPEIANRCTRTCSDSCPNGWDCRGTTGADPVFICQPPVNNLCEPCTTDAQCGTAGDRCVSFEDGRYCGRDCQSAPTSCPTNYTCGEVLDGNGQILAYQCLPASGSCNCPVGTDYDNDPLHCGGCNKPCVYPGGVPGCAGGECVLDDCEPGYVNLNLVDNDGCEYACVGEAGADDWPDAACNGSDCDQDCDGLDGTWTRGVFVAPNGGANAAGTAADPLGTVSAGITKAKATGKDHVYIAAGTYNEQVTVQEGVSLFGGYSNDGKWTRNLAQYQTVITASSGFSSVRALVIENVQSARTVIDGLSAIGGTNANPGGSSYGIWVKDCSNKLELTRVTALGGNGGAGQSGAGGSTGSDGVVGQPGTTTTTTDCNCDDQEDYGGFGGAAGTNQCGAGLNSAGGKGGDSGCGEDSGDPGSHAGSSSPGGAPGGPSTTPKTNGKPGAAGDPGTNGGHGAGGAGAGEISSAGYWRGADGIDGTDGGNGIGGGGGSGGGGGDNGTFTCATWGGGGGGGGSGGCGGTRGTAGKAGGGSFGLFLFNANPKLTTCALGHKSGGNGGNGGVAGSGGTGKGGGAGGGGDKDAADGGKGGSGGNGGHGGHGGGGAGGVAYGLYLAGTSAPTCASLTYSPPGAGGSGGLGGVGGTASGNKGADGAQGDKNKGAASCP